MTETQTAPSVVVTHRGARLQLQVADWIHGAAEKAVRSLHVQDLAGGAGRIYKLDQDDDGAPVDATVRELVDEHPEVDQLVHGNTEPAPEGSSVVQGWPQS